MYYMRHILNISLPKEMMADIRRETKTGKFSSVSEFVRAAIRAYRINQAVRIIKKGEKEYREGKTVTASSIADLL